MKPTTATTLKVLAAGFLLFAAAFIALSVPLYVGQRRILKSWSAASARIVSSRVITLQTASGRPLYDTEYMLAFSVGARTVLAKAHTNHQSTNRDRKQKQAEAFPAGSTTTILYNPANPAQVLMQPGYNVHFFAIPLFLSGAGAGCVVLALILLGVARLARSRAPEVRPSPAEAPSTERGHGAGNAQPAAKTNP